MYRRIFIASLFNPASIPANPSSRPFSGLALNTSSGCKKASPETVSLSAASLLILAKLNLQHHVVASRQPLPFPVYPERLGSLQ